MSPDDPQPDAAAAERDRMRHELATPLTTILSRAQLLQRQVLRADGLSTLDRTLLLGNVAAVLAAARLLESQLQALVPAEPGGDPPVMPVSTTSSESG